MGALSSIGSPEASREGGTRSGRDAGLTPPVASGYPAAMRVTTLVVALLTVAVASATVRAQESESIVRLEGRFGSPTPGRTSAGNLTLQEMVGRKTRRFQASAMRVLEGGGFGQDILDQVSTYDPSLYLAGPASLLKKLDGAGDEDRVAVTGQLNRTTRLFEVGGVEVTPQAKAAPPTTP
jgi:hypothetical protein